jgi:hypothetical protein
VNILSRIYDYYNGKGITKYFIACTDLHICKKYLLDFGIRADNIIDIIELAGDKIIGLKGKNITGEMICKMKEIKIALEKKYL